jgi:hypothetical protein
VINCEYHSNDLNLHYSYNMIVEVHQERNEDENDTWYVFNKDVIENNNDAVGRVAELLNNRRQKEHWIMSTRGIL